MRSVISLSYRPTHCFKLMIALLPQPPCAVVAGVGHHACAHGCFSVPYPSLLIQLQFPSLTSKAMTLPQHCLSCPSRLSEAIAALCCHLLSSLSGHKIYCVTPERAAGASTRPTAALSPTTRRGIQGLNQPLIQSVLY